MALCAIFRKKASSREKKTPDRNIVITSQYGISYERYSLISEKSIPSYIQHPNASHIASGKRNSERIPLKDLLEAPDKGFMASLEEQLISNDAVEVYRTLYENVATSTDQEGKQHIAKECSEENTKDNKVNRKEISKTVNNVRTKLSRTATSKSGGSNVFTFKVEGPFINPSAGSYGKPKASESGKHLANYVFLSGSTASPYSRKTVEPVLEDDEYGPHGKNSLYQAQFNTQRPKNQSRFEVGENNFDSSTANRYGSTTTLLPNIQGADTNSIQDKMVYISDDNDDESMSHKNSGVSHVENEENNINNTLPTDRGRNSPQGVFKMSKNIGLHNLSSMESVVEEHVAMSSSTTEKNFSDSSSIKTSGSSVYEVNQGEYMVSSNDVPPLYKNNVMGTHHKGAQSTEHKLENISPSSPKSGVNPGLELIREATKQRKNQHPHNQARSFAEALAKFNNENAQQKTTHIPAGNASNKSASKSIPIKRLSKDVKIPTAVTSTNTSVVLNKTEKSHLDTDSNVESGVDKEISTGANTDESQDKNDSKVYTTEWSVHPRKEDESLPTPQPSENNESESCINIDKNAPNPDASFVQVKRRLGLNTKSSTNMQSIGSIASIGSPITPKDSKLSSLYFKPVRISYIDTSSGC